jgi:hypothetical protein
MLFRVIDVVYSENHVKYINAFYGQNADLNVTASGIYSSLYV